MREGGRPEPPYVAVLVAGGADPVLRWVLREVLAGLEEEGVPAVVEQRGDPPDPVDLATRAARGSPLEVGVGIAADATIALAHRSLEAHRPVDVVGPDPSAAQARRLGQDAARIVVRLPLKSAEDQTGEDPPPDRTRPEPDLPGA